MDKLRRWPSRESQPEEGAPEPPCPPDDLTCIPGMTKQVAARLNAFEFHTFDALREASDEELLAVPGVGPGRLKKIRAYLEL